MKKHKLASFSILSILILFQVLFFTGSLNDFTDVVSLEIQKTAHVLWEKSYPRAYKDAASSIVKDPNGGYIISGFTNSSGKGNYDILILKIAANGSYLWNKTYGAEEEDIGYEIINCRLGGFALASTFTNTSVAVTNSDFLITKLSPTAHVLWNHSYSGPNQDDISSWVGDEGFSIAECSNDDLIAAGVTRGPFNDNDIWLMRLLPTGRRLWQQTYHKKDIDRCFSPHSVLQCQDGGFAVVGYTYNITDSNQVWLIKVDSNGNELWNRTFGDTIGFQRPAALVECNDGGFGILATTKSFGAGDSDIWLIRTNAFGQQLWNKTFGGPEFDGATYLQEMLDGGFAVLGSTHNFGAEQGDAWLLRTDSNGDLSWNFTFGDMFGNSGAAFIFEGDNTFTIAGSTNAEGEPFSDIWALKVRINISTITTTPSSPTETSSAFTIVFVVPFIIVMGMLRRTKLSSKKVRK